MGGGGSMMNAINSLNKNLKALKRQRGFLENSRGQKYRNKKTTLLSNKTLSKEDRRKLIQKLRAARKRDFIIKLMAMPISIIILIIVSYFVYYQVSR